MITTLIQHGDQLALVLDRLMLESLGIKLEDSIEVTTVGKSLNITRATKSSHQEDVQTARAKINTQYREAFQKLAE